MFMLFHSHLMHFDSVWCTFISASSPGSPRGAAKKNVSLTALQTETMFIQLLSCPARGIQNWHLNSLACLQGRPKKSVFLICTMVRQSCRETADPNPGIEKEGFGGPKSNGIKTRRIDGAIKLRICLFPGSVRSPGTCSHYLKGSIFYHSEDLAFYPAQYAR